MLESQRAADSRTTGERQADLQVRILIFYPISADKIVFSSVWFLICDNVSGAVQGNRDVHGAGDERAAREGLGPGQLLLQRGEKRAEDRRGGEVKKVKAILDPAFGHEH